MSNHPTPGFFISRMAYARYLAIQPPSLQFHALAVDYTWIARKQLLNLVQAVLVCGCTFPSPPKLSWLTCAIDRSSPTARGQTASEMEENVTAFLQLYPEHMICACYPHRVVDFFSLSHQIKRPYFHRPFSTLIRVLLHTCSSAVLSTSPGEPSAEFAYHTFSSC